MRKLILLAVLFAILIAGFAGATYTAPSYTNVTIVLDASYTAPSYTNVTIVLGEEAPSNCWTETNNIIFIPNGCVYQLNNGVAG